MNKHLHAVEMTVKLNTHMQIKNITETGIFDKNYQQKTANYISRQHSKEIFKEKNKTATSVTK